MVKLLTSALPASLTRGWDLPEEVLHAIMLSVKFKMEDESNTPDVRARAKHALVALSLVNKHWSAAIRPLLFRNLRLSSLEDALFLQDIVCSPSFPTSILMTAIEMVSVRYYATLEKHWVCHVHVLMHRLPHTHFVWYAGNDSDDVTSTTSSCWNPYSVVPSVPPFFLRPFILHLNGVHLANPAKLVRVIDSFPSLGYCHCYQLSFGDASPYVPSRWRQRQSATRRPLKSCSMAATEGLTITAQAMLVSDILRVSGRLGLDDGTWRAVLGAIGALVSKTWDEVSLDLKYRNETCFDRVDIGFSELSMSTSESDIACANVFVHLPNVDWPPTSRPLLAYIRGIQLDAPLPGMQTTGPTPLDALHSEIPSAVSRLEELSIRALAGRKEDVSQMAKILCAVLRRDQLSWALCSRRLRFERWTNDVHCDVVSSEQILSVPAEHVIDDTPVALDVPEQAEWLLRFLPAERDAYLRQLVAQRAATSAPADATILVAGNFERAKDCEIDAHALDGRKQGADGARGNQGAVCDHHNGKCLHMGPVCEGGA